MRALTRLSILLLYPGCYTGAGDINTEPGDAGQTVETVGGSSAGPTGPGAGDTSDDTTGDSLTTGGSLTTGSADTTAGIDTVPDTTGVSDTTVGVDTGADTTSADVTSTGPDTSSSDDTGPADGCTAQALELIDLVNAYRGSNGLPAIPASKSLCTVSSAHVHDLSDNNPHGQPGCNLHSWSNQGPWSACCYTPDHAAAQCMWDKPAELTVYPGYGYENAASGVQSAMQALQGWQGSQAHNAVILNQGIWADHPWGAVGAGLYNGYAVLWFGVEADPG